MERYRTILADPPWPQSLVGKMVDPRNGGYRNTVKSLPYPTMTIDEICRMPVGDLAERGAHLWLRTTNQFLEAGFQVMRAWGFKYLAPIHWKKPSGAGMWFIHHTQTLLFGYKDKCEFNSARFVPNWFTASCPSRHSRKPEESYQLIEKVSDGPRLELFARPPLREGWQVWGNEIAEFEAVSVGWNK
jgi:N6-adenosine-specific RNA methylase IME4